MFAATFYNSVTPLFIANILGAVSDFSVLKEIPDTFVLLKGPHLQTDAFQNYICLPSPMRFGAVAVRLGVSRVCV